MYSQRINRDDPERVFINVKNIYTTASLAAGDVVCYDVATFDGVRVTQPLTANLGLVVGVAAETIATNGYGLVQCWGYRDDVDVDGTTGLAAGDVLKTANASFDLAYYTTATVASITAYRFIAGEAFTTGLADKKVFIRCL
jgi:hypothetical protein